MKKQNYEAPVMEQINVRFEENIMSLNGGSTQESLKVSGWGGSEQDW